MPAYDSNLAAQIRKHYLAQGYRVRIKRDGRVSFRKPGEPWLEGRWTTEYRLVDGRVVLT